MSRLVGYFLLFMGGFITLFSLVLTLPTYSHQRAIQLDAIAHITQLPSLNFSSGYLQQSIALYEDDANAYYLKTATPSKREFVYAR